MVRTMMQRDGNAENFWSVARPCATGKQLAAISDIRTGSPFVNSSAPVHIVPFPAVEHFLTSRNYAFVAQHFLNNRRRWRHLQHNTSVGLRTWPQKIESIACETKGRHDAFHRQRQCERRRARKDLQRKDEKKFLHNDSFMKRHCQINKSAFCCENRVFCIPNGLFFSAAGPAITAVSRITAALSP